MLDANLNDAKGTQAAPQTHPGQTTYGRLSIVYLPIAELKLDLMNPRVHTPRQIRQIARSVEHFGFNVPVLVDAHGKVIAGHGRVLACQLLGWTEVPTICLEHLNQAQARAFMIADNRLTEISEWDDRLLAEQLKELSELNLDLRSRSNRLYHGRDRSAHRGTFRASQPDDSSR